METRKDAGEQKILIRPLIALNTAREEFDGDVNLSFNLGSHLSKLLKSVDSDITKTSVKNPLKSNKGMERVQLTVEFARLDEEARLPTQGSSQAAGWDLYALEETVVVRRKSSMIRTGLAVAIPEGWEGQIRCRSSLGKKGMIMPNGVGTIDSDYRGELMVLATWIGEGEEFIVAKGERVAQLLFAPVPQVNIVETSVEDLGKTERGQGGFGSTGQF